MLHAHLPVLLVVLLSSVLLVRVSSAPHRDMVTELLKSDLMKDEDLDLLLFLKLVPEVVTAGENEVLPELEEESGVREEVVRRHLPRSHRERKAGCRNFFWKTFTSC